MTGRYVWTKPTLVNPKRLSKSVASLESIGALLTTAMTVRSEPLSTLTICALETSVPRRHPTALPRAAPTGSASARSRPESATTVTWFCAT